MSTKVLLINPPNLPAKEIELVEKNSTYRIINTSIPSYLF